MIQEKIEKITGIRYDRKIYRGFSGALWFAAGALSHITSWLYVVLTAGALPLYVKEYALLGTEKARFWMNAYKLCGKLFLIVAAIVFIAFVSGVIAYYDDEDEERSLAESGYVFPMKKTLNITVFHVWILFFMLGAVISYLFSEQREIALCGERGWYCGMQQYIVIGLCALVISFLGCSKYICMAVVLLSSFSVCASGILMDIFGNVFRIADWSEGKVSTLGNANWFCGYFVMVFFLGTALYFFRKRGSSLKDKTVNILLVIYLAAGSWMLVSQGSSSGYAAVYAVFVAMLLMAGRDPEKHLRIAGMSVICFASAFLFSLIPEGSSVSNANDMISRLMTNSIFTFSMLVISVTIMVLIRRRIRSGAVNTYYSYGKIVALSSGTGLLLYLMLLSVNTMSGGNIIGNSVFYFSPGWGSYRGETISVGFRLFEGMNAFEKLFGKGPDTFYSFLTGGRFPVLYQEVNSFFGGARLTNAHCEPVTLLVNIGIFGTLCFYGMLISFLIMGFKKAAAEDGRIGSGENVPWCDAGFVLGSTLCILAYMVNNLFSFQTPMNLSQLSVILAFGASAVLNTGVKNNGRT